ncbi:RES family NAD+ phosphorylase (plasmid) [Cereibacter azotoformans]|uniref:RES family NAD+ phosphorylase n=1 Tax=Cereibacter azotoformans TaxID=43057 RepID=UPI001EECED4F|nr:RES family NAD+ phosphorylase [Cereibacter azotoformans]ULB12358.1 RES family NAD+ phosphorylase [Cereibacter azotoformans]
MKFGIVRGTFYRIVPMARAALVLDPAVSPEGRFHHDNQPALYVSPRPDWAEQAIKRYVRNDDPSRIIVELEISESKVLDLRDREQCASWGADASLAAIPWLPQRAQGLAASTWRIADLARENGADGMIYTARSEPSRWHLVLFNWSDARATGRTLPFPHRLLE